MRDGWAETTLGELCDLVKGVTPTMKAVPGEYPLVVTAEERRSSDTFQFDGEAVCIPMVSSTGHGHASLKRVHYEEGRFAVANIITACLAKNGSEFLMKYLWYLLGHRRDELIVPLMRGTANVSLSQRGLKGIKLQLPPLEDQHRVVDLIQSVDEALSSAETCAGEALRSLSALREAVTSGSESMLVSDVLEELRRPVDLDETESYTEIGVRSHGRGVFLKEPVPGDGFGTKKVFWMSPGALVFNIVFAWEGAVALLGDDAEGLIASHRFPNYTSTLDWGVEFMAEFFKTKTGVQLLSDCSPGGAGRNRTLNRGRLLGSPVMVPPVTEWPEVVDTLRAATARWESTVAYVESLRELRSNLLTALLSGEHEIPESYDELMEGIA